MKITREIKVAVLVISGIALFIYLFSFLMGENLLSNKQTYYTEFDYNSLSMSSPVTIKGNKIGKVEEIKYEFETGKTRVAFTVNPDLTFSKNSTIRLYETGLMGGNALAIIDANDGNVAEPGDFIASEVQPGLVNTLKNEFTEISGDLDITLKSADSLVTNLNELVEDDSAAGLKSAIAELNVTLKSFNNLSVSVQSVISENDKKIATILDNFEKTSTDLSELAAELKAANLGTTVKDLDKALVSLQGLLSRVENGEGTIGKLLKDEALYNNLEGASAQLELLLLDIKLHPARYRRFLSKREIPYEAPTQEQLNNN